MIRFCCEHCGRKITVQDKHAGKRGKCPQCGTIPPRIDRLLSAVCRLRDLLPDEPSIYVVFVIAHLIGRFHRWNLNDELGNVKVMS